MFKKNTAVAGFPIGKFIKTDDGSEVTTGTPTCKRIIDGAGGSCANAASYDATSGLWKINLATADMNGDVIGLAFSLAGCQPITYTIKTVANGADDIYSRIGAPAGNSLSADVGALLAQIVHSTLNVSGTQTAADGIYYLIEYLANGMPYYGHSGGGWYLWYNATTSKWLLSTASPPIGQNDAGILPLAYWYLSASSPVGTYAAVGYANAAVVGGNYSNPGTLVDLAISAVRRASRLPGNPSAVGDAMALTNDAVENIQDGLATSSGVSSVLAAVQNVQNNTFIAVNIPGVLQVPEAGSPQSLLITVAISDETGAAHDIDSSASPAVVLVNNAGTDRSSRLSVWQHPSAGKYTAAYTNSVGDAIENLYWEITATVNEKLRRYVATTQLVNAVAVDFTATDRQALSGIAAQIGTAGSGLTALGDSRLGSVDAAVAQIKAKTDNLPANPAAAGSAMTLQSPERDAVAAALLDTANAVDGKTPRQALRIISAILAGKVSGSGSGTETFRGLDDQHDRVVVTADVTGNRTNVTYP